MADGITLDKVNVEIESNSSKAATSIDKLTESIKKLQSATSSGTGELSKLNTTIKGIVDNINNSFNNIGNINTENVKRNISNSINKIDKSFTGMSSKTLKNKLSIKPEFDFESFKDDTDLFQEYGEKTKIVSKNGEVVSVTLKKVQDGIETVTTASKKGITQTEKYTNEQSKLYKVLSAFGKIGFLGIAKKVFTGIGKYTDMSSQYISNMNYFNTTMGTMKDTATDFVNTMERDFYLDPSNVMNYMASFNSLIKGFGIADKQAYKMSKNLTQLSYDLAAFKGLSIEDAMQKIKSGISGELEPMRAIGVALDQATLQETAYKLGIEKRVSTMTRAQKTELLYYQMMQSTSQAQNYFANTLAKTSSQLDGSTKLILNPASALSILKQQFSQLGRAIGNIFIPILTKMIPYIMAATQVLMDLANAIAAAFGFELSDYDFSSTAGSISSGIDGIGESADKTAKKVKGMLAPFDELNTIDFGNNGGGDTGISGGGSLGLPEQNYDWLKNDALNKRVQEIKEKFEDLLPIIEAIGAAILTWKVGKSVLNFLDQIIDIDKKGSMKQLLGLTLMISGITLMYGGLKKVMSGEINAASVLEVAFGGAATYVGGAFLFKVPVKASTVLLLTLDIVLLTSIIGWWNKYYDETKKELYNNKKDLNLGEFLNVSFTAIGTGVGEFLDSLFGENFTKGIEDWFREHDIARDVLGVVLQLFTGADLEGFKTVGGQIADNIMDGLYNMLTGKTMADKIWGGIEFITGIFQNDINKMLLTLANVFENIPIVGDAIATAIRAGVSASEQDMSNTIKYTSEKALKEANPWVQTKSEELGRNSITAYNSGFTGEEPTTRENIKQTIGKSIVDNTTNLNETADRLGRNNISAYKTGFIGEEPTTKESIRKTINNGLTSNEIKLNETANRLGNRLNTGVKSGFENNQLDLNSGFKTTMNNAITSGEKDLNRSSKTFGENLGDEAKTGFENGFNLAGIKFKTPQITWGFTEAKGWKASVLSALGLPTILPKMNISWYAEGGFPEVGDLFIANENGPEWISTMGGKSAVANQDQMTTGIRQAAYEGVSQALRENPQSHKTEVNIGNRKVYEGYGSYQTRQANKYGVSTVTI